MNAKMAVIAILVSAVITFGLRALPFLVFQEGKELPDKIKRLGMVLPSSITAVSYKWKHNTLISILLGTVSYMLFLYFFG
ncbi:AzlD domain-containing protein [Anaerostipes hadrus]|jgi:branched-subunit amino acid transport protein AzlD|nr:AzlD domain-containing protein [Anaerostipes hadrus]